MLKDINKGRVLDYYQNLVGSGFEEARALTTFHYEEARLFEESMMSSHPDLEEYVKHLELAILIPIVSIAEFLHNKIPSLETLLSSKRKTISLLNKELEKYPGRLSASGAKFIREQETQANELGELIEDTQSKLEQSLLFEEKVFRGILQKTSQKAIITFEDYAMQDINVRNEIYKDALGVQRWLLGYNITSMVRAGFFVAKENTKRWELYQELDGDARALLQQQTYVGIFPKPLGVTDISGKTAFEKIYADAAKNLPRSEKLLKNVEKYFEQRLKLIYK